MFIMACRLHYDLPLSSACAVEGAWQQPSYQEICSMCRTLLVDPNADFRHEISRILRANFVWMEVLEASTAEECLDNIDAVDPDLVMTEIRLPGIDGLELTKRLRARHPHLPVIVLSAYELPEYRQAALARGATANLAKESISADQLVALVRDLVFSARRDCGWHVCSTA